ncbi:hypothetical protein CDAR_386191 [Caerostris darwini]|uniref:Uncharacterized protein n=1 Tax=Caerostris darwini TaxID=1538125 RepID=A0AAV4SKK6_9ARAC|nr:hypothetical protein CDAR_386191 [Caerostris darwini]
MKRHNKVRLTETILEISTSKIGKIMPSFLMALPSWYEIVTSNFLPSTRETRFRARNMSPHSDPRRGRKSHISQENNFSSFCKQKRQPPKRNKRYRGRKCTPWKRSKRGFGILR